MTAKCEQVTQAMLLHRNRGLERIRVVEFAVDDRDDQRGRLGRLERHPRRRDLEGIVSAG